MPSVSIAFAAEFTIVGDTVSVPFGEKIGKQTASPTEFLHTTTSILSLNEEQPVSSVHEAR
jgi:hypothetical protein